MARLNITDGPSKLDFMLALFDGDYHRRKVEFCFEDPQRQPGDPTIPSLSFVVNEVSRGDGLWDCDENWLFKGYFPGNDNAPARGFFSTRTRKGWIEF